MVLHASEPNISACFQQVFAIWFCNQWPRVLQSAERFKCSLMPQSVVYDNPQTVCRQLQASIDELFA